MYFSVCFGCTLYQNGEVPIGLCKYEDLEADDDDGVDDVRYDNDELDDDWSLVTRVGTGFLPPRHVACHARLTCTASFYTLCFCEAVLITCIIHNHVKSQVWYQ